MFSSEFYANNCTVFFMLVCIVLYTGLPAGSECYVQEYSSWEGQSLSLSLQSHARANHEDQGMCVRACMLHIWSHMYVYLNLYGYQDN